MTAEHKPMEADGPRTVRVFVSSTFRDMQGERDELVKRAFPQLRSLCEKRGVTWGEVDLRWGVTEEQAAEGRVLPICLEEIRRCRPYFIGLLGERYGWVPDELPAELVEQEPWLAKHRGRSVTELEVLHGVLNDPEMAGHAFFYFRAPSFLYTLPASERSAYREEASAEEIARYGAREAERRAQERRDSLDALKERIRASGLPVREIYPGPKVLGELVLEDLRAVIDGLYPEGSQPDPLDREASEHEAFARSRAQVYIGGERYYGRLDAHARGDGPPLVVRGESGLGKSALLANWALRRRESHEEQLAIVHFCGATPHSADWAAMLRRIMGELSRGLGIEGEVPDPPDLLRAAFARWLDQAAARGRVVLVLDGLNQLEDRDQALDLVWLPAAIPSTVRLLLSTTSGRPLEALQTRGWPSLEVQPLAPQERRRLIGDYLAQYTKTLSPARSDRVAAAPQCANPLYLRALLEELRLFGVHERLDERIGYCLSAGSAEELYEKVLRRYEEDYQRERPGLVGEAMSLLWAARRGLSEAELLDLLGSEGRPLPRAHWSPLFLAAEASLVSRSGLLGFFHDYIRRAVERRYLPDERARRAAHQRLADYFHEREVGPRRIDEEPWQLAEAGAWQRLSLLLGDLDFFYAAWKANPFEVKARWSRVEAGSDLRMVSAYLPVLEAPSHRDAEAVWSLSMLLGDTGHQAEALALRGLFVEHYRRTGKRRGLATALLGQAQILHDRGDLDGALALLKEQEALCRELEDTQALQASLDGQAVILQQRGDLVGAVTLFRESERLCRELGSNQGLKATLYNQATVLRAHGDVEGAMRLLQEVERLCRELGDKAVLSRVLNNEATILHGRGDLDGALALLRQSEQLSRDLGDKQGLQASLSNQAEILQAQGDAGRAMGLLTEQERLCREADDKKGLLDSLASQGVILHASGDLARAMALFREAEQLCRGLGDQASLATALGNQAEILRAEGDLVRALSMQAEAGRLHRETGNRDGLATSLNNQGLILQAQGDLERALVLLKESERLHREAENREGLHAALGNQGLILHARGDLEGALALFREKERLCRELGNGRGLANALVNQAWIVGMNMERPRQGLAMAEEAYRLAVEGGYGALARQVDSIRIKIRARLG